MSQPKPIKLTEPPDNTQEQCDATLGAYLRAWDQLDAQLRPLFSSLLGTHQNATLVLLRIGIDQPKLRNILQSISSYRLKIDDKKKLKAILRRWEKASSKRNRIVHGHWQLNITMVEGSSGKHDHTKSTWVRFYPPSDPATFDLLYTKKDQKTMARHEFSLESISRAEAGIRKLAEDIKVFVSQTDILPFVTPKPIELDQ